MGRRHRRKRHRTGGRAKLAINSITRTGPIGHVNLSSYWRGSELIGMLDKSDTLHIIGRSSSPQPETLTVANLEWSLAACGVYFNHIEVEKTPYSRDIVCPDCSFAMGSGHEGAMYNHNLRKILTEIAQYPGGKKQKQRKQTIALNNRPPGNWFERGQKVIITQYDFRPPFNYNSDKISEQIDITTK